MMIRAKLANVISADRQAYLLALSDDDIRSLSNDQIDDVDAELCYHGYSYGVRPGSAQWRAGQPYADKLSIVAAMRPDIAERHQARILAAAAEGGET